MDTDAQHTEAMARARELSRARASGEAWGSAAGEAMEKSFEKFGSMLRELFDPKVSTDQLKMREIQIQLLCSAVRQIIAARAPDERARAAEHALGLVHAIEQS